MRDTELYRQLLGLNSPWRVERVELMLEKQQVHVWVEHGEERWECPECGEPGPLYDHSEERVWRHLDTMQYTTLLHARPPRVSCDEHGVRQVALPWAEPKGRFTMLFECFAIGVLRELGVAGAQRLLRISRDEAWQIEQRAVERGLARKKEEIPELLGIDEKAWRKGQDSYLSLLCDLDEGNVEWIGDDRKAETLGEYFGRFTLEQTSEGQRGGHGHVEAVRPGRPNMDPGRGSEDRLRPLSCDEGTGRGRRSSSESRRSKDGSAWRSRAEREQVPVAAQPAERGG
jgi:transposase